MRRIILVVAMLALLSVMALPAMAQSWWDQGNNGGDWSNQGNNWWDQGNNRDNQDNNWWDQGNNRDNQGNNWWDQSNNTSCNWYWSWWEGWTQWCWSPWWGWYQI